MVTPRDKNTVIIVDDDEDLQKLLATAFKRKGFVVQSFEKGGDAALYMSKQENLMSVCLIVLDRMLPDMDGLDLLKKFIVHTNIPILILSVLSTEKDVLAGFKSGAADYIAKPFSLPVFMEKALRLIA